VVLAQFGEVDLDSLSERQGGIHEQRNCGSQSLTVLTRQCRSFQAAHHVAD
jgi:hypothetical protein